jgi:hypothetical protein
MVSLLDRSLEDIADRDGLAAYLARDTSRPEIPPPSEMALLDEPTLRALNDARLDYVCDALTVLSPHVRQTLVKGKRAVDMNAHLRVGRKGVLVTGDATTGKTRACLALMRATATQVRKELPDDWQATTPVVYVCVPSGCTSRGLLRRFADFYHVDYAERTSADTLRRLVVNQMRRERTLLLVVDEMHNLGKIDQEAGVSVDTLKDLSNAPFGTFVYAGIDVAKFGLLSGSRGRQIAGRFFQVATHPFPFATKADRAAWEGLVAGFADALPLAANEPAELVKHARWLHDVTGGYIGSLQSIISQAVAVLISANSPADEVVTRDVLDGTVLDIQAEERLLGNDRLYESVRM